MKTYPQRVSEALVTVEEPNEVTDIYAVYVDGKLISSAATSTVILDKAAHLRATIAREIHKAQKKTRERMQFSKASKRLSEAGAKLSRRKTAWSDPLRRPEILRKRAQTSLKKLGVDDDSIGREG